MIAGYDGSPVPASASQMCVGKRGMGEKHGDLIQSCDLTTCQRPYLKHNAVCKQALGLESEKKNGFRSWVSLRIICVCSGVGSSSSLNYVGFVFSI